MNDQHPSQFQQRQKAIVELQRHCRRPALNRISKTITGLIKVPFVQTHRGARFHPRHHLLPLKRLLYRHSAQLLIVLRRVRNSLLRMQGKSNHYLHLQDLKSLTRSEPRQKPRKLNSVKHSRLRVLKEGLHSQDAYRSAMFYLRVVIMRPSTKSAHRYHLAMLVHPVHRPTDLVVDLRDRGALTTHSRYLPPQPPKLPKQQINDQCFCRHQDQTMRVPIQPKIKSIRNPPLATTTMTVTLAILQAWDR